MISLRDYQDQAVGRVRGAFRAHNKVLFVLPTGGGKTVIASYMAERASQKGRVYFICHRKELVEQTVRTFEGFGIHAGVIATGFRPNLTAPVQVCMIDTLKGRLDRVPLPSLVIWDECHHIAAAGWARVAQHFEKSKHVGLTATPERLDGKGLRPWFPHMVLGPAVSDLIEAGHLADYRLYMPSIPNMQGVKKSMGDFQKAAAAAVMDNNTVFGDVIKNYRRQAADKQAVAFCVSIEHSQHTAERFRQNGYMSIHVDGTMPQADRKAAIRSFRNGDIKILSNVDLFGEGFDVPGIEAAILLRPTQSLGLYLQQVGRALRPSPGKDRAILLDHAGNALRHGLPDDERAWDLDGKKAREKKENGDQGGPAARQCPNCFHLHPPRPKCPSCHYVYPVAGRQIDEIAGDLAEVDPTELRRARMQEQAQTKSIDGLVELARKRGYKNPEKWAGYVWTSREAKQRGASA